MRRKKVLCFDKPPNKDPAVKFPTGNLTLFYPFSFSTPKLPPNLIAAKLAPN